MNCAWKHWRVLHNVLFGPTCCSTTTQHQADFWAMTYTRSITKFFAAAACVSNDSSQNNGRLRSGLLQSDVSLGLRPTFGSKQGPACFRAAVDPRLMNNFPVLLQVSMPNLVHDLTDVSRWKVYETLDFFYGCWQLHTDGLSRYC